MDAASPYAFNMAVVRILVDGYSLLHNWPQLAPGAARHSAEAREALIHRLTLYRDAIGTPITIVFDGSQPKGGKFERTPTPELEVLFSREGQTADDIIERAAVRLQAYGEVLAVTDDSAERETVYYHGGMAISCLNFIVDVETALKEQEREIARRNRAERLRFKAPK
jgi:predicted RNA-binding protein with PIN domain